MWLTRSHGSSVIDAVSWASFLVRYSATLERILGSEGFGGATECVTEQNAVTRIKCDWQVRWPCTLPCFLLASCVVLGASGCTIHNQGDVEYELGGL